MTGNVKRSIATNSAVQIFGRVLNSVIGVVTIALLLRYLGTEGYGIYTTAITYLTMFAIVADFGLTLTTVQLISDPNRDSSRMVNNLLSLRILSGIILFLIAPAVSFLFLPYDAITNTAILIGAAGFLCNTSSQMLTGLFQKHLAMWRIVVAELVHRIAVFGIILAIFWMDLGLIATIIALVIGNAIQLIFTLGFAKKFVQFKPLLELSVWKEILSFSWPIGLSILFNLIYLRGDIFFLSLMRSPEEVGIYGAAYKLIDVITALPVIVMGLMLPVLVRAWETKAKPLFKEFYQHAFDVFGLLAIPIAAGSLVLATPIMELVGGSAFGVSGSVLVILAPATGLVFFGTLFGHMIVAIKKQRQMVLGYAIVAAISIIGYFVLIPEMGMYGAAWVTLVSEALITLLTLYVVWKTTRVGLNIMRFFKSIVASAAMVGVLILLPESWHVMIDVLIGAAIYGVVILSIRGIDLHTIKHLFHSDPNEVV